MSLKIALPLALAAACLPLAGNLRAATYTESGDAGDMLANAQQIIGANGTTLSAVVGATTFTNGFSDSDMYEIYIPDTAAFSATTTNFVPGSNNFDTQLALFSATGFGVIANDDTSNGSQSTIPTNSFTGAGGLYYLLISGTGRYAASGAGAIFPNVNDAANDDATGVYGPSGPGGAGALSTYVGNSSEGGKYSIALTGAQFFIPAAVPEPGACAFVFAGAAGMAFALRARRHAAR